MTSSESGGGEDRGTSADAGRTSSTGGTGGARAPSIDPVALVTDLVRCPSPSGEEQACAKLLVERLAAAGLRPESDGRNVWVEVGRGSGPTLLLLSHIDTVPVGEGWTRPALDAHREGQRIYGRGSNDAKGCVSAMAAAIASLDARALPGRVLFAAVCEEETGRPGGFADLQPRLARADAAVVGEPTGLIPVCAQKGMLSLEATARGRQAHAARPEEGDNAIVRAARGIVALDALRFPRTSPELGPPTAQVTIVRGGERKNVIPASCTLSIDVRTIPEYTPDELAALIAQALGPQVDLVVKSDRLRAQSTSRDDPIMRAAVAATGSPAVGSPTVSDWAHLRDVPAVKLGPGESPRSHTPDEWVGADEVTRGAEVYRRLIEHWFLARG